MIAQHLVLGNESLESWPMESGLPNVYNPGGRTAGPSLCSKINIETIFADLLREGVRIQYGRPYWTVPELSFGRKNLIPALQALAAQHPGTNPE